MKTMSKTPTTTSVFVVKAGDEVLYRGTDYSEARKTKHAAKRDTTFHRVNVDSSPS